jgi:hypothetical protein
VEGSARPSSISLKIGIVRVFSKKHITIFKLSQKASHKKLQGYQLFDFARFLHHNFFDNSTSFYCRNWCVGVLVRYFIKQNSKNNNQKKPTTTIFFKKNVGFFYFSNFALKSTFLTRPHTCNSNNWMAEQSLKIYQNFREGHL